MYKSLLIQKRAGFTLIEMLVSLAILAIILVVLAQTSTSLSQAVNQTTSQVREFQAAQDAFETMTRRISQATLNAYNDTAANTSGTPANTTLKVTGYTRASELRFISGPASDTTIGTSVNGISAPLFSTTTPYHPTHAIFFQAPLGYTTTAVGAFNLVQMMNTCGYYIEWNSDVALGYVPAFITPVARWRFRLMEMVEPSDNLTVYTKTSGGTTASNSWTYSTKEWIQTPYNTKLYAHPIADNVILLAFLPMVAPQNSVATAGPNPDGTSLDLVSTTPTAPTLHTPYFYDTSPPTSGGTAVAPPVSMNQLPPLVYVEMIAVDEKTFAAYQRNSTTIPSLLGVDSSATSNFLTDATQLQSDVKTVTDALKKYHIKYRVFSTIVPITAH